MSMPSTTSTRAARRRTTSTSRTMWRPGDLNTRARAHAKGVKAIVHSAKERGVSNPTKITEATPLYENILSRYVDAIHHLNTRRAPKNYFDFADYVAAGRSQHPRPCSRQGRQGNCALCQGTRGFQPHQDHRGDAALREHFEPVCRCHPPPQHAPRAEELLRLRGLCGGRAISTPAPVLTPRASRQLCTLPRNAGFPTPPRSPRRRRSTRTF